jgi:hypothetical protein
LPYGDDLPELITLQNGNVGIGRVGKKTVLTLAPERLMLAAMRSGRSENITVIELTPSKVSLLADLSNVIRFAVCTNRKSACFAGS